MPDETTQQVAATPSLGVEQDLQTPMVTTITSLVAMPVEVIPLVVIIISLVDMLDLATPPVTVTPLLVRLLVNAIL